MGETIELPSREVANRIRDKYEIALTGRYDRRFRKVELVDHPPDSIEERILEAAREEGGDPITDEGNQVNDEELSGKQLGALRRAWGAYVGGAKKAYEALHTINEIRDDVAQDPLGLDDLHDAPGKWSDKLLEELNACDHSVPQGHDLEEFAEIVDPHQGPVPEDDLLARLDEEGFTVSPEELEGVGAVGMGEAELREALRAEDEEHQALISESLEEAKEKAEDDTPANGEVPDPPSNLSIEDLAGRKGWELEQDDPNTRILRHPETAILSTGDNDRVVDTFAELVIDRFGRGTTADHEVRYKEYHKLERRGDTYERQNHSTPLSRKDREYPALVEAWEFLHLPVEDRIGGRRFGYPTETRTFDDREIALPRDVNGWELLDPDEVDSSTATHGRIAWETSMKTYPEYPNGNRRRLTIIDAGDEFRVREGRYTHNGSEAHSLGTGDSPGLSVNKDDVMSALASVVSRMEEQGPNSTDLSNVPEFRLEASQRVIKPVVDAVKRVADQDRDDYPIVNLYVDEDGLRFETVDSAQVAMIEAEVDAEDIRDDDNRGVYQVTNSGHATINAAKLWAYIRDGGLTDTLRIQTKTFDAKGVPPRLYITIDGEYPDVYDGHRNRLHVWLHPGDQGRDPPNTPGYEAVAGFDVEAREWKEAVRDLWTAQKERGPGSTPKKERAAWVAVDEGDQVGLVELEANDYDEDADEESADVEAVTLDADDVHGHGAVGYALMHLRDLSIAVPRPASTTLSVEFGTHRDEIDDSYPFAPIELTWYVGASRVRTYVAPRIIGDDGIENYDPFSAL